MRKRCLSYCSLTSLISKSLGQRLAGDEEAVALGVVGDAVEDVGLVVAVGGGQQTAAVDRADHFAGLGVDARRCGRSARRWRRFRP